MPPSLRAKGLKRRLGLKQFANVHSSVSRVARSGWKPRSKRTVNHQPPGVTISHFQGVADRPRKCHLLPEETDGAFCAASLAETGSRLAVPNGRTIDRGQSKERTGVQ
jgi:hypothetical protein